MLWVFAFAGSIAAMAAVQPMLLRFVLPALLAILLAWTLLSSLNSPARQLSRLLQERNFEEAFDLARRNQLLPTLREFLHGELPLPAPGLRRGLGEAFEELCALHGATHDTGNIYIDPALRQDFQTAADNAMNSFWDLARNLAVVAQQQAGFGEDHPKIRRIVKLVESLQFAATEARRELAELTLGASGPDWQQAREALAELNLRREALRQREPLSGFPH